MSNILSYREQPIVWEIVSEISSATSLLLKYHGCYEMIEEIGPFLN